MATWNEMTPAQRDQLVAERVAGYERHEMQCGNDEIGYYWTKDGDDWWYGCDEDDMPHYSQDIVAAFSLLRGITNYSLNFQSVVPTERRHMVEVEIGHDKDGFGIKRFVGFAATDSEAICKALLLAHDVDI